MNKEVKILQILPRMNVGGVERGVLDLAGHLGKNIVVVSGGGHLVPELLKTGARHYSLPVYRKSLFSLFLIVKLRRIIKKEKVSIVHARSRVPALIGFFATRGLDVPFITTAHGAYSPHIFSGVMSWGKFVICPSQVIARHMIRYFSTGQSKIKIISRWVDLDRFTFRDPKDRISSNSITCIGRISPSKGFEYVIESFRKVIRRNPYLILQIVGEADKSKQKYLDYLHSLTRRFSLDFNVKFLGYRGDVENVLNGSYALVVPSVVEEAFGRVIVEAFACGVPVVATKTGAFEEIIRHEKDGILVPPKDPDKLAEAILHLLEDASFARKLALKAREKVESRYSFAHCAKELERVYDETLSFKRILILKFSALGDLVLIIPSLKAIKEKFPRSEVTLLTLKKYVPLFYGCPYLDKVTGVEENYKKLIRVIRQSGKIRAQGFDYIVDFQNNFTSHLISFFGFPGQSFGYSRKAGFLLTSKVRASKPGLSPLDSQEKVLNLFGAEIREKKLSFWDVKDMSLEHLGINGKGDGLIGINVSASRKWKSKNWPAGHIRKLIELISREYHKHRVVLLGDEDSFETGNKLAQHFSFVDNLCGKTTLRELILVLKKTKVFISQDTASLHLSLALGVKTIGLFGPTDPGKHAVTSDNLTVISKKVPCSFCYKPNCPSNNLCMEKITPQEVFSRIKPYLVER